MIERLKFTRRIMKKKKNIQKYENTKIKDKIFLSR